MTQTAFISGHLNLSPDEFAEYYAPAIQIAIRNGDLFVVGDAPGADRMAQAYLFVHLPRDVYRARVTVYHAFTSPRHHVGGCPTQGGYPSHAAKDYAMTEASDYDILYVRPEKHSDVSGHVSGTEANALRRMVKRGQP